MHRGMLEFCADDDELAVILAHERGAKFLMKLSLNWAASSMEPSMDGMFDGVFDGT